MSDQNTTPGTPVPQPPAPSGPSRLAKATGAAALIAALALPVGWAIAPASAQDSSSTTTTQPDNSPNDGDQSTADAGGANDRAPLTIQDRQARRAARRAERQSLVAEK